MKLKSGYTPREFAFAAAIDELRLTHRQVSMSVDEPASVQRAMLKQLAKLHNKLLAQSGLDGLAIEQ